MNKNTPKYSQKILPLNEVAIIDTNTILPSDYPNIVFYYIALEHIESLTGNLVNFNPTVGKAIQSNKFRFDERHVLLGKLRPYLNKVHIPSFEGICSTDILPLLPKKDFIDRKYLAFCLRSPFFVEYAQVNMQGTKMPRLRTEDLKLFKIPIPPLEEQQRIVSRIEALNKRVEEARKLRQQAIEDASKYFFAAISNVFKNKKLSGWQIKKIKELCGNPQYGFTASSSAVPVGPKLLRITDIQNGKVNWSTVPYCPCEEIEKYKLERGDILFARTGATTGKSYLIKETPETAIFASYLIRLRAKEKILPEFLYLYFQSSSYWHSVYSGVEDGNRPNMNGSKLANLKVSFPSDKNEQRRIVTYFEKLQDKISKLINLQEETETKLNNFTPALLAKAFREEL